MGNPIKQLARLQAKTLLPTREGFGGQDFDKMLIAGALAGLPKNAQNAALCIWCMDYSLTLDLAEELMWETFKTVPATKMRNSTALNLCQWVVAEFKSPNFIQNKKTGEMEIKRITNAELARKAGISKQNFNDAHENFYNSAVGVLQSWLNEAYVHVGEHLSDVA